MKIVCPYPIKDSGDLTKTMERPIPRSGAISLYEGLNNSMKRKFLPSDILAPPLISYLFTGEGVKVILGNPKISSQA